MLLYLGENRRRFLWCCCCILIFDLHFLVVLHLSMFFILLLLFIHIFYSTSSLTLPWIFTWSLHPFYTFSPAHLRVIRDVFIFNHSVIFLPWALRYWVGIFYPQGLFTLHSFTNILNLHLSRLPQGMAVLSWSLQSFILILICLFDSQ